MKRVELCLAVMPGHDPMSLHHRCQRYPHADSRHDAPVTLDHRSVFAEMSVSWIDPIMEWEKPDG